MTRDSELLFCTCIRVTGDVRNWLVQCGTNGNPGGLGFMANYGVNVVTNAPGLPAAQSPPSILGLNSGGFRAAFWGFAEFIMWDRVLSVPEFYTMSNYLMSRSCVTLPTGAPAPSSFSIRAYTVPRNAWATVVNSTAAAWKDEGSAAGSISVTLARVAVFQKGLFFSPNQAFAYMPNFFHGGSDFTIAMWIAPMDFGFNTPFFSMGVGNTDTGTNIRLYSPGTANQVAYTDRLNNVAGNVLVSPPGSLPVAKWSHIALTVSFGTATGTLYLNGVAVATNTVTAFSYRQWNGVYLGRSQSGGDSYFTGALCYCTAAGQLLRAPAPCRSPPCSLSNLITYALLVSVSSRLQASSGSCSTTQLR